MGAMFMSAGELMLSAILLWPFLCHLLPILALESPPQLECLENSLRLHFVPDEQPSESSSNPFGGHVYVKGFFFSAHCHLDYQRQPISQPFYMHIPYRSECQVKRERANGPREGAGDGGGGQPSGVLYSVVVIVQHHRLFVTNRDKAYSVSCFYRDAQREFERRLEVGDLDPTDVTGQREAPTCQYEVLREGAATTEEQQQPVRFANIGESLIHRWSCDTDEMGMLVHSCSVRDGLGHSYALLDQRGCVNDQSLLPQLQYGPQLNSSSVAISAFKFADQMIVFFRCQITLCDKRDNGCEGITPPTCQPVPLPSEGGPEMRVQEASARNAARQRARSPVRKCCQNAWSQHLLFGHGKIAKGRRERREVAAGKKKNGTLLAASAGARMKKGRLITVDVAAEGLIVFTRDEGPSAGERNRLLGQAMDESRNVSSAPGMMAWPQSCPHPPSPLWALTGLAILPLSLLALFLQRRHLQHRIRALSSFSPAYPVQMANLPSSFGHSPLAKPRHYGRL